MKNSARVWMATAFVISVAISFTQAKSPEDFISSSSDSKKVEAKKSEAALTKTTASLDTTKLHALYLEGDFDKAIKPIESYLKSKQPMSHADSTFAFKHLGVMYAAAPATREKGKYYMYQLINMEPTAKILDMYASDMIYLIFRNVQEDFELKQSKSVKSGNPTINPAPSPAHPPGNNAAITSTTSTPTTPIARTESKKSTGPSRTTYLVTGGAVVAVGVVALAFLIFSGEKSTSHTLVVTE